MLGRYSMAQVDFYKKGFLILTLGPTPPALNQNAGEEHSLQTKIITSGSGEELLKTAVKIVPDVIITQLGPPGKSTIQMCRLLKSDRRTTQIPIILLTEPQVPAELKMEGLEAGADDLMTSPVDQAELRVKIKFLKKRKRVDLCRQLLSECSQLILRTRKEKTLLHALCRTIIDCGNYRLAWIGSIEHDRARSVRPIAQAGFGADYIKNLHLTWADTERGRGPYGCAVRTGKASVSRNILTDPKLEPWRQSALKNGYRSVLALPLINRVRPFAVLLIYSGEADTFTPERWPH